MFAATQIRKTASQAPVDVPDAKSCQRSHRASGCVADANNTLVTTGVALAVRLIVAALWNSASSLVGAV